MEEVVYYVISFPLTIIGILVSMAYWLGRKFAKIDEQLREMRKDLSRAFDGLKSAVISANFLILDLLAVKKLLKRGANIVKSEIARVISTAQSAEKGGA